MTQREQVFGGQGCPLVNINVMIKTIFSKGQYTLTFTTYLQGGAIQRSYLFRLYSKIFVAPARTHNIIAQQPVGPARFLLI